METSSRNVKAKHPYFSLILNLTALSAAFIETWALLAVATETAKEDKILGFESITKALKALDAASPSPYKTELALLATAMLVKDDSRRAFETLSAAVKYANSFEPKDSARTKPAFAFGLDAAIGKVQTRLGVVPLSLSEVKIDPALSSLAITDWFRADQITREIRDPSLRLSLRLQFAGAVLSRAITSGNPAIKLANLSTCLLLKQATPRVQLHLQRRS